jgi:hypothetical protein
MEAKTEVKVGDKVQGKWSDGRFYSGTVAKIGKGRFFIKYDDGDQGWTTKLRTTKGATR